MKTRRTPAVIVLALISMTPLFASMLSWNPLLQEVPSNVITELASDFDGSRTRVYQHAKDSGFDPNELDMPFSGFIENKGQLSERITRYYCTLGDTTYSFKDSKVDVNIRHGGSESISFSISFNGAHVISPDAREQKQHIVNYLLGQFQVTEIPTFNAIWYPELYSGIDLRYYCTSEGLKYEFLVKPGADPSRIGISVDSAMPIVVSDNAVWIHSTDSPQIAFQDTGLLVFQEDGSRVDASFISHSVSENAYGYEIANYDKSQILTIDPWYVSYSTLLGGNSMEEALRVVHDNAGNIYILGTTSSMDFPYLNGYQDHQNWEDLFVVKLNPSGEDLIYSTFLGGSDSDYATDLAVDASGRCYVSGYSYSTDFPVQAPYQASPVNGTEAILAKLNSAGTGLVFGTYFGGNMSDVIWGIDIDSLGNVYVAGTTESPDLPIQNANQSTQAGGSGFDAGCDVAVDETGRAYICGRSGSTDFPTERPYQDSLAGSADLTIAVLNSTGNGIDVSTYFGASSNDNPTSMVLGDDGCVYVVGYTYSLDFPAINAYQATHGGSSYDSFMVKFNPSLSSVNFSTYLGGSSDDRGFDVSIDSFGNCYASGETYSADFPTFHSLMPPITGSRDFYAAKFGPSGEFLFCTNFGGLNEETAFGCTFFNDSLYVVGLTISPSFYTTPNAYQSMYIGNPQDAFLVKFSIDDVAPTIRPLTHPNGSVVYAGLMIGLNLTDNYSGIDQVIYNWNHLDNATLEAPYYVAAPSEEAVWSLQIYVSDKAGNWAHDYLIYIVDNTYLPTIDSPEDIQYEEGTTGHLISWHPSSLNTSHYVIYQNSSILRFGFWNSSTEVISVDVDGLPVGIHSFTLEVNSTFAPATDTVVVTVLPDMTPPSLDSPSDIIYAFGAVGNTINWTPQDTNPQYYEILLNGSLLYWGIWNSSSEIINVNVDGLPIGTHSYMVRVSDIQWNNATDLVEVSVISHEGFSLNNPPDVEYTEGETGNTITWIVNAISSYDYRVHRNGEMIFSGNQNTESVSLNIDYLVAGSYNFTLSVIDVYERQASDTVWVSVLESAEETNELASLITNPVVLSAVGVLTIGYFGARYAIRSRRRAKWRREFGGSWALEKTR